MLRSNDAPGLEQELWGLLATYQMLRMAMADAAQAGGLDPDRASFTIALETARDTLTTATGILPTQTGDRINLIGVIGRVVLAHPLPARRARYSARKVKSPISRYHARPADDDRPLATTSIATVTTQIHEPVAAQPVAAQPVAAEACSADPITATPGAPASSPARRPRRTPPRRAPQPPASSSCTTPPTPAPSPDTTGADDPARRPPPTAAEVLDLLRSDPYRPWHGRDVAQILNVTNINSLCTRMSQWAHEGLRHKIGRATYTLEPPPPVTHVKMRA